MRAAGRIFGKKLEILIRDTFFFQYVVCDQERDGGTRFFYGGDIQQKGKVQTFSLLVGHPDLPVRKTLMRMLGMLTVIVLKRVSESIFFQSNKFTACKVIDEKEVTNSLMVFNRRLSIHFKVRKI